MTRKSLLSSKKIFISVIVPAFNEGKNITRFIKELSDFLSQLAERFEIIVVDDGSRDDTVSQVEACLSHYPVKLLAFSRNFGKEIALTAGLEHVSGDVAIMMDADFQHPIEVIPTFLSEWANGHDMVYGVRRDRASEQFLKRRFAQLFYWLMQRITQIRLPRDAGDFRLLDKTVVQALTLLPERTRFMKGLYAWVGFKQLGVPFSVEERAAGQSGWGYSQLAELAITGITSFSDVPLRIWGWVGFVISCVSLIYALYIVTVTLLYGADLPGFPTLVVAIMFFGGVQLLSIGILGEYIARIFTEVKHRPKYILRLKAGFSDESHSE